MRPPRRAKGCRRAGAALLAALLLALTAAPAQAQEDPTGRGIMIAWDLIFLRPISLAQFAAGCALFVPVYLMSLPNDTGSEIADRLVFEPARWTFQRPLGTP